MIQPSSSKITEDEVEGADDVPGPSVPRKSTRTRKATSFGSDFLLYLVEGTRDKTVSLREYCYIIEEDPRTALGCKWILKRKMKVDGSIDKYKARLVIQGFRQKEGIDFFDTYAPVARITTIRLLLALAAIHDLVIHQMDVKTAFLNGDLDEAIYMKQPEGFVMPGHENKVCKLKKSLYGLKQAPKQWHQKFDDVVLSNGEAEVILGIRIKRGNNGISVSQSHYIEKILTKFNFVNYSPVSTPVDPTVKFRPNKGAPVKRMKWENDDYICRGHILNGMDDSLFDIYQNIESTKALWESLESKYMAEDASSKKRWSQNSKNNKNNKNKRKFNGGGDKSANKKSTLVCWKCNKPGHMKKDCRSRKGNNGAGSNGSKDHEKQQGYNFDFMRNLVNVLYYVFVISDAFYVQDDDVAWWVDSGATCHVCKDLRWFQNNKNKRKFNGGGDKSANKKSTLVCWKCNKPGHMKNDCRSRKSNDGAGSKGSNDPEKQQGYNSDFIQNFDNVLHYVSVISDAFYVQDDDVAWWVDLGATCHVCKDLRWFQVCKSIEDGSCVKMGNVAIEPIKGMGCILLTFTSGKTLCLDNVLHVPGIQKNLVSEIVLNKCGYKQVLESDKVAEMKNRTLKEMVNSMLSYSGLSEGFWGTRDKTVSLREYCYIIEEDPRTLSEAMASRDVAF
nr:zinc finger, CCHC-type [Tanacetum cinerariifolium]